ncbi:MAG: DUF378 domain-containing protein [Peptococcaceae bacterium]|nr:DUF378 domain-containing protein [Peptococcaceae bacterium]
MRDWLYKTALVLTIIGAINWGLMGLFHLDFVSLLFGGTFALPSVMSRIIYTIIGLGGLTTIGLLFMSFDRKTHDEHDRSTVRPTY